MALSRARRERSVDYWPGFVDALSTLILGIIFMLTVFVIVQFYLSQELTSKDTSLQRLTARIAQLTEILSLEQAGKLTLEEQMVQLRASLAATQGERDRYKGLYDELGSGTATAQGKVTELAGQLDQEKQLSLRQQAQIEVLNQQLLALRRQLTAIEQALEASETRDKEAQSRILDLGARLNLALAQRVQELTRYRSDFFGRLSAILGNRPDIRVVGDRFVFQSELFFDTGQAVLKPEGRSELDQIAGALSELDQRIPNEIAWVLRVDGHTDVRPVSGATFKSNWELSAARSISVVQYLISKGIAPQRLVAAGFGEFQPIDGNNTDEAYSRNRRIELKLTER
jgi:chemotaxis protein MotB